MIPVLQSVLLVYTTYAGSVNSNKSKPCKNTTYAGPVNSCQNNMLNLDIYVKSNKHAASEDDNLSTQDTVNSSRSSVSDHAAEVNSRHINVQKVQDDLNTSKDFFEMINNGINEVMRVFEFSNLPIEFNADYAKIEVTKIIYKFCQEHSFYTNGLNYLAANLYIEEINNGGNFQAAYTKLNLLWKNWSISIPNVSLNDAKQFVEETLLTQNYYLNRKTRWSSQLKLDDFENNKSKDLINYQHEISSKVLSILDVDIPRTYFQKNQEEGRNDLRWVLEEFVHQEGVYIQSMNYAAQTLYLGFQRDKHLTLRALRSMWNQEEKFHLKQLWSLDNSVHVEEAYAQFFKSLPIDVQERIKNVSSELGEHDLVKAFFFNRLYISLCSISDTKGASKEKNLLMMDAIIKNGTYEIYTILGNHVKQNLHFFKNFTLEDIKQLSLPLGSTLKLSEEKSKFELF